MAAVSPDAFVDEDMDDNDDDRVDMDEDESTADAAADEDSVDGLERVGVGKRVIL